jgi:hypothetical protein
MRILRNKKGLDYATLLMLNVFITVIYLYIQLANKLEPFQVTIGESQIAVLNAYQEGENALLYVDQAAKYSAYQALGDLAQRGGISADACGTLTENEKAINAWTAGGKNIDDCLGRVQPYDAFAALMNKRLDAYLAAYKNPHVTLPANNYDILVQDKSVTGTAIEPAIASLKPPTEIQNYYVGFLKVAEAVLKKAAIGEYAFKPSFTVAAETKIDAYDTLKTRVKNFYTCTNDRSIESCAVELGAATARSADNPDYIIVTVKNPVTNPHGAALADIALALYAPATAESEQPSEPAAE